MRPVESVESFDQKAGLACNCLELGLSIIPVHHMPSIRKIFGFCLRGF